MSSYRLLVAVPFQTIFKKCTNIIFPGSPDVLHQKRKKTSPFDAKQENYHFCNIFILKFYFVSLYFCWYYFLIFLFYVILIFFKL